MSSSVKIDNRKKYILILGKGPTQGLEHALSIEIKYSIEFIEKTKKIDWVWIIMEQKFCNILDVPKYLMKKMR